MSMTFAARLQLALSQLDQASHTTGKGMRLQQVMELVINAAPGFTVVDRNKLDMPKSAEVDLWISHDRRPTIPFIDPLVPIECKNEEGRASASQIRDFAGKIQATGGADGLLVARKGLSGEGLESAHNAIHSWLNNGIRILVVTGNDLSNLRKPSDFAPLLKERYVELRLNRTYVTL
ncbi:hypothetical protein ABZ860_27720 [Microbispora sp. NPDC046973]|uniref:hypothetical protein n=1 Tax=Microbispora sp. NPDC046973 TaxID=3155022 RepID=UPI0034012B08